MMRKTGKTGKAGKKKKERTRGKEKPWDGPMAQCKRCKYIFVM